MTEELQALFPSHPPRFRHKKFPSPPPTARCPYIPEGEREVPLPDFEIRYFHADGSLTIVHMTSHATLDEAEEHARRHQHPHDRFEVREVGGAQKRS